MAQQLTKGVYGHEFRPASNLFGLSCGQIRSKDFVHNGGWYNRAGEKLGWGDLSVDDFQRIYRELNDDELFIILGERDSFWNFVTRPGLIGSMAETEPTVEAPGVDYVAEKCRFIIGRNGLYLVDEYGSRKEDIVNIDGLPFRVLTCDTAKTLIVGAGTEATPQA